MDINIILGVLLIIIFIYFVILVFSLWRRNQQAEQAAEWNDFREQLFVQAQEDQVNAHRISLSLQNQYKGLGVPYEEEREKAFTILRGISENAMATQHDQKSRKPISLDTEPYSWKTFLIQPLWVEYQDRQRWWQATQEFGFRLSKNPSGFSAVEKLENKLASKGQIIKAEFESMKQKMDKLEEAFRKEARTPSQFQDQFQQLRQLSQEIDDTIETYLSGSEFFPKQVAMAAPNLRSLEQLWGQLKKDLDESQVIRRDTRTQLEKNQAVIDTLEVLLKEEAESGRPTRKFRETLKSEVQFKQEQERQREAGTYLKPPAREQFTRLQELEKNLGVLIQERLTLEERLARSEREINQTEAWIKSIEAPFIIDESDILLQEIQQQQSRLYQLMQSTEDVELLRDESFIDPQKLASKRTNFDQQVNTYQSLYQELYQQVPPMIEQMVRAIQSLGPLNTHYQQGLNLGTLAIQTQSLEDSWAAAMDPPQIEESQIEALIEELCELKNSFYEIKTAYQRAQKQYDTSSTDRIDAQRIIEDQAFTELHQVMLVISREDEVSLARQAGGFASQAEELNASLERIDTDFSAATSQAARLLVNMKTLWGSYKQEYAVEKKEYNKLAEKLMSLQNDLEKYEVHELTVFHSKVSDPLIEIYAWLQALPSQSIQALMAHNDEGYVLQVEMEQFLKEIAKENQNYTWAKEDAKSAITDAKSATKEAEKELGKIPWGKLKPTRKLKSTRERSPELEHSYRYLDSAEDAFKEITDPGIEYLNSVEKAISDLSERVSKNANNAKDEAKYIQREIREQINDIHQKRDDLEKTLADGEGYSMRLDDTGFRSQWQQIYRKYSQFESELDEKASYREAFSYLEQALIETRYQIERMREFEKS